MNDPSVIIFLELVAVIFTVLLIIFDLSVICKAIFEIKPVSRDRRLCISNNRLRDRVLMKRILQKQLRACKCRHIDFRMQPKFLNEFSLSVCAANKSFAIDMESMI